MRSFEEMKIGHNRNELIVMMIIYATMVILIGVLGGCAGPSKSRYKELLHQCRESNRKATWQLKYCKKDAKGNLVCPQGFKRPIGK